MDARPRGEISSARRRCPICRHQLICVEATRSTCGRVWAPRRARRRPHSGAQRQLVKVLQRGHARAAGAQWLDSAPGTPEQFGGTIAAEARRSKYQHARHHTDYRRSFLSGRFDLLRMSQPTVNRLATRFWRHTSTVQSGTDPTSLPDSYYMNAATTANAARCQNGRG